MSRLKPNLRQALCLTTALLMATAVTTWASPPATSTEVTDYGRTPWRTHYAREEPQYPASPGMGPEWEVPLGLSRSQPLVIKRDLNGDGTAETRIYHLAGDHLWALNGDMKPAARRADQSVEEYREQLRRTGFILWHRPAMDLCAANGPRQRDELLNTKCTLLGSNPNQKRPYASSQASYWKGATPADDVIYAGFGYPASVAAIRPTDGTILGGYIVEARSDRGIVGAPLVFAGDRVVINTTTGEGYILRNMASGVASVRGIEVGGRMSYSPLPLGENGFILASDGREAPGLGPHGYMMAYSLAAPPLREFTPLWPSAVITPSGIPGEAAVAGGTIYLADKHGRLYALRHNTGELVWCRQYENRSLVNCYEGGPEAPGFINNGPGVDEEHVYYVFRNSEGRQKGGGFVVALRRATGEVVWQQTMMAWGNTAPVPMG